MRNDNQRMHELIEYIQKKHTGMVDSTIERHPADAGLLEQELGLKLPPSYKEMVNRFGTLGVMSHQFLGTPANPDLTIDHRSAEGFLNSYVVVYQVGDGSLFCIDTAREVDGDNPVIFWDFGAENDEGLGSKNFSTFVVETIWEYLLREGYDVSEIEHLRPANPGWNNAV